MFHVHKDVPKPVKDGIFYKTLLLYVKTRDPLLHQPESVFPPLNH